MAINSIPTFYNNQLLTNQRQNIFNALKEYLKSETRSINLNGLFYEIADMLKLSEAGENQITFAFGENKFMIKGFVLPLTNKVFFRTYEYLILDGTETLNELESIRFSSSKLPDGFYNIEMKEALTLPSGLSFFASEYFGRLIGISITKEQEFVF